MSLQNRWWLTPHTVYIQKFSAPLRGSDKEVFKCLHTCMYRLLDPADWAFHIVMGVGLAASVFKYILDSCFILVIFLVQGTSNHEVITSRRPHWEWNWSKIDIKRQLKCFVESSVVMSWLLFFAFLYIQK